MGIILWIIWRRDNWEYKNINRYIWVKKSQISHTTPHQTLERTLYWNLLNSNFYEWKCSKRKLIGIYIVNGYEPMILVNAYEHFKMKRRDLKKKTKNRGKTPVFGPCSTRKLKRKFSSGFFIANNIYHSIFFKLRNLYYLSFIFMLLINIRWVFWFIIDIIYGSVSSNLSLLFVSRTCFLLLLKVRAVILVLGACITTLWNLSSPNEGVL